MPTYDVTISFAGEDRPVAERLASLLVTKGLNVFYDEYERANLWGKDLYVPKETVGFQDQVVTGIVDFGLCDLQ